MHVASISKTLHSKACSSSVNRAPLKLFHWAHRESIHYYIWYFHEVHYAKLASRNDVLLDIHFFNYQVLFLTLHIYIHRLFVKYNTSSYLRTLM